MEKQILGFLMVVFGGFLAYYLVKKDRKQTDIYSFVRTLAGAILIIIIGFLLLFERW